MLGAYLVSHFHVYSDESRIANNGIGEDALANLSIEQEGENGPITGFVRIRSRSQGLALSLGSLKGLNKIGSAA